MKTMMRRRVHILMQETHTTFRVMMESAHHDEDRAYTCYVSGRNSAPGRSAMQHPDIRRAELKAMLRRVSRRQPSDKARKTYWTSFMAGYLGHCANNNVA